MDITDGSSFAERFRNGQPDEAYKRQRPLTRRELVARVKPSIEQFRREGYSWEGIAEYFATLGVPMSVATLKNYLRRSPRPNVSKRKRTASV